MQRLFEEQRAPHLAVLSLHFIQKNPNRQKTWISSCAKFQQRIPLLLPCLLRGESAWVKTVQYAAHSEMPKIISTIAFWLILARIVMTEGLGYLSLYL